MRMGNLSIKCSQTININISLMDNNLENKNTKRGVFLWVMLGIYIFVSFQRLLSLLFPSTFSVVYAGGPSWGYDFNVLMFVAVVTGIVGIIRWKAWGMYLIAIMDLAAIFVDQVYFTHLSIRIGWIFSLGLLGLLIWSVSRRRQFFE